MTQGKCIVITTGGTGGHVFPAYALADQLKMQSPEANIVLIGSSHNYYGACQQQKL